MVPEEGVGSIRLLSPLFIRVSAKYIFTVAITVASVIGWVWWEKPRPKRDTPWLKKGPNPIRHLPDGTSVLTLTYKDAALECLIDTADYPLVSGRHWHIDKRKKTFYAGSWLPRQADGKRHGKLYMHTVILPGQQEVDHGDGNGLNNRRLNIRGTTRQQNAQNQGRKGDRKFRGLSWDKENQKWMVLIRTNGRRVLIGRFVDEEAAARAYDEAAKRYHAEFANLKLPTTLGVV